MIKELHGCLLEQVDEKQHDNFERSMQEGADLSLSDIKNLNIRCRASFIKKTMADHLKLKRLLY